MDHHPPPPISVWRATEKVSAKVKYTLHAQALVSSPLAPPTVFFAPAAVAAIAGDAGAISSGPTGILHEACGTTRNGSDVVPVQQRKAHLQLGDRDHEGGEQG